MYLAVMQLQPFGMAAYARGSVMHVEHAGSILPVMLCQHDNPSS